MSTVKDPVTEDVLEECPVCGQRHCPCTLCHGDPDYFLGANPAGANQAEAENVCCSKCGVRIG